MPILVVKKLLFGNKEGSIKKYYILGKIRVHAHMAYMDIRILP